MNRLVFPFRVIAEVAVVLFDMIISRYLIAALVVALFWTPAYLLFGAGYGWFIWPTFILGLMLSGLWEGCEIFTVRERLARYGIVRSRND